MLYDIFLLLKNTHLDHRVYTFRHVEVPKGKGKHAGGQDEVEVAEDALAEGDDVETSINFWLAL